MKDVLTGFGTVGHSSGHLDEHLPTNSRYEYRKEYIDYVLAPPTEVRPINWSALALLRSWAEDGDEREQRDTWEYLKRALDEDRLSDRKHFP